MQVFSLYKSQDSAGVAANARAGRVDQLAEVGKLATKNGGEYCTTLVRRLFNVRFLSSGIRPQAALLCRVGVTTVFTTLAPVLMTFS